MRLNCIPPAWTGGCYCCYETFHLKNGHTVKLPMDRGEGQHWNIAPGNIYSKPVQLIPPIAEPQDTRYIKHIRIQSKLLTEFWGRPMYIGAHVLLPEGFDDHPRGSRGCWR